MDEARILTRREALLRGGAAAAGLAFLPSEAAAHLERLAPRRAPSSFAARTQEAVVPWLDVLPGGGRSNQLDWQALTSWLTPTDQLFRVAHYGYPELAAEGWTLSVTGRVRRPLTLTLAELRARPRREITCTIECGGNRGFGTFMGAVHNARWGGTPLAPILEEAGIAEGGIEVVFFGADAGEEEIRGNTVRQNFGRSLSVQDAMDPNVLLAYEVNGGPLPTQNGFPLRLIVPGWYGVASVKWLNRIEVYPTRFQGRFMARDYVTLREVEGGVWVETSVGRGRINSMPARVTRDGTRYRIHGAAWGADIARVEVRIDDGPWRPAVLGQGQGDPLTWTFWTFDWERPAPGEHTVTSRAVSRSGEIQPAPDDPLIARKATYWESNGQYTRRVAIG